MPDVRRRFAPLPPTGDRMSSLPEPLLQFGSARFLRPFVDLFVHRANHHGHAVVTIVPCELRENQADQLQGIVNELARAWRCPDEFIAWMNGSCFWLNTLVDRIVTGTPREHPLLASDPMLTVCEPYALFAVQQKP